MRYHILLASVLVALVLFPGCSKDDPVMPEIRRGTISIAPEPDGISPRWTLTGPDKSQMSGTGNMRLENLEPGDYTIVWGVAQGWAPPDGSSVTQTLEPGETLVFSRLYTALPPERSITIATDPEGINAPWQLSGPDGFNRSGIGHTVLRDMVIGSYTLAWGDLTGYNTPNPVTLTLSLSADGALVFLGKYTLKAGTITINALPGSIDSCWRLAGPEGILEGTGNTVLTDMRPGQYTLVWCSVPGWNVPDPASVTQALHVGGSLVFTGEYAVRAGTITINALPSSINPCWRLAGPEGILEGTGNTILTDRVPGQYTLAWCDVPGWTVPEPATMNQTLLAGQALTFTGEYTARTGTITINPQPEFIDPCWMLTGPGVALEGSGGRVIPDMEPGDYVLAWCELEFEGWTTPSPNPVLMTLQENGTLTFTGVYTGPVGSIEIDPRPETILASWELTGPGGFVLSGEGNEVLENRILGEYTLTWGDIDGYSTPIPNPDTRTLSLLLETIVFTGEYEVQPGTIIVQPEPTSIDAPWMLAGHEGFCHEGNGYTVLTDLAPGDYTLTWRDVVGWTRPSPATETKRLVDILTFNGAYSVHFGTIMIDPKPTGIGAPWLLTGPGGFCRDGEGNSVLTDMYPGTYTLTWLEMRCWTAPSPATMNQTLQADQTLVFSANYAAHCGEIAIRPEPETLNVSWMLTGPHGYCLSGEGRTTLSGMMQGQYTLTWLEMDCWTAPSPATVNQTLQADQRLVFSGNYTAHLREITIQPEPEAINAPWILEGPGFRLHGSGNEVLSDMGFGTYSITWGDVLDWATPPIETQELAPCDDIMFIGVYHYGGNPLFVTYIPPGEFLMGSPGCPELDPWYPTCYEPGRYNNETQHQVILTRGFYMSKHEVTEVLWDDIMGSGTSTSQRPKGGVSWDMAVAFCNALSLREGLAPAYTIHSSNGHVTWNRNANGYRLPTEAEWEYACRAGTVLAYNNDTDCLSSDSEANFRGNTDQLADCPFGVHRGASTEVGRFPQPNAWGLFDMHGNVREWVWDAYESHFPIQTRDPVREGAPGVSRVIRGGHWNSEARQCRSAFREPLPPSDDQLYNGLRPVRTAF